MAEVLPEAPPLPQGVAYGLVCGFGLLFALFMNGITWVSRKYLNESADTNMQLTARKTVKTGLVASAVVSSWCYAATLMNSVRIAYLYGMAGLYWFAAGCSVQILLFAIMGIELKRRAPRANTILEAVRIRFGTPAHLVFFAYGVSVQILITASLLLGGSSAFTVTTGANIVAMNYLIPLGVVIYTYLGGLKSTFLSDYIHTWIIYVILLVIMFTAMTSKAIPILGSPGALWDIISSPELIAKTGGAIGAKDGSYLTMQSGEGLLLAAVILVSGFGSVFVDPSYGQKAIAGEPGAVVRGYFYGSFAWFSIPFGLCSTVSFVAIALQHTEYWPYPGGITRYQIENAMILPLAAQALLGTGGSVAVVLMILMAVSSSFSSEIIAHSSIVTFDIYQAYINPTADDKRLKLVSHISLTFFSVFSASFATALNYSGVSMGWLLEFIGVSLGPAVIPIVLAVNSSHVSPLYMACAAPIGSVCSIIAWLVSAKIMYGAVTVATTYENWPLFIGCMLGTFIPLLIWAALYFFTEPYDWDKLFIMQALHPRAGDKAYSFDEVSDLGGDWDPPALAKASREAKIVSLVMVLIFLVIIPFSLYGTGYIFSRGFFTGWTVIVFLWAWVAALLIWLMPIWEARHTWVGLIKRLGGGGVQKPVSIEGSDVPEMVQEQAVTEKSGRVLEAISP